MALGLGACEGPLSTLAPAGPAAREIALVWWVMLAGSAVILAGVFGLILYAFKNNRGLRSVPERVFLWGGGLAFPLIVLTALLAWGLPAGQSMLGGRGDDVLTVQAEGFQWGWRFSYPEGPDGETIATLHIPAGEYVDVEVTAADVIHAFWTPRLAGKIDAIPGQTNIVRIFADAPGTYPGRCAEFCGLGHAGMNFVVEAHPADAYDAALIDALSQPPGETPEGETVGGETP